MQLSLFQPDPPPKKTFNISTSPPGSFPSRKRGAGDVVNGFVEDKRNIMSNLLDPYLPDQSTGFIVDWLIDNKVRLRISNTRTTKLGDYRPSRTGSIPGISVNHNLNKYSFLITLVHEMAHHAVYTSVGTQNSMSRRKKNHPKPHGAEWQSHYRNLMGPFMIPAILPQDVIEVMIQYLENPKASTTADQKLFRILRKYDKPDGSESIDNLPFDAVFHLRNGRSFRKKEKMRKRYRCISIDTGRIYLFNPLAQVFLSAK